MTVSIPGDVPDWIGATDASADTLLTTASAVAVNSYVRTVTVGKSYRSIVIQVSATGYTGEVAINVSTSDAAGSLAYNNQSGYLRGIPSAQTQQWIFPCPAPAGGSIRIAITPQTGPATFASVVVVGSTNDLSAIYGPTRSDGLPYPLGVQAALLTAAGTLIAAPGPGHRIMLAGLQLSLISAGTVSSYAEVAGTIGGVGIKLQTLGAAISSIAGSGSSLVPPSGLLLDDNTAVTVATLGVPNNVNASAVYDVIS